jgi:hypothetical protein
VWIAGDAPGTAPVYFHFYPWGTDRFFVEYHLFYGNDECRLQLASVPVTVDLGGHRADWDSTVTVDVRILRDPQGGFLRTEVQRTYVSQHGYKFQCDPGEFSLVDEQGLPDPRATHPVAYVGCGKHGAFPEPGEWLDRWGAAPLMRFDESFRGNGYAWTTWTSPLLDLEGPATPEFAPPSFAALAASLVGLKDWRAYLGSWASDAPPTPLSGSPSGPRTGADYGSGPGGATLWRDAKAAKGKFRPGAAPSVVPAPVPVRK